MIANQSLTTWADKPHELLNIPSRTHDIVSVNGVVLRKEADIKRNSHSAIHCATEMAHAHNALLRGLNSIVLQGPHVQNSTQSGYSRQDVLDLLKFAEAWVMTVDHHHTTEETCIFPLIEELAKEPGLMQGPHDQHAEFHPGLEELLKYTRTTKPEDYRWDDMNRIINGFADSMVNHLHEEIDVFLSLDRLDSVALRKCFDEGEKVAKAQGNIGLLYDIFPLILGCCDKTYDGGNQFPPLPAPLPYAVHYWFGRRYSGAWRFNPCDYWGQPVPLRFLPEPKLG